MNQYTVELTDTASETYQRLSESATRCIDGGDAANSKVSILRAVDQLIQNVIPQAPIERGKCLAGPFLNIYWVSRERLRIYYRASPTKPRVIVVLYISDSPRKETHRQHVDALFAQMMVSGQLDHLFSTFGLKTVGTARFNRPPN
jgi:hypothetical protein